MDFKFQILNFKFKKTIQHFRPEIEKNISNCRWKKSPFNLESEICNLKLLLLCGNKSLFNGEGGQSLDAMEIQFLHEVGSVFFNRLDADTKILCNLFVLISLGNQL